MCQLYEYIKKNYNKYNFNMMHKVTTTLNNLLILQFIIIIISF